MKKSLEEGAPEGSEELGEEDATARLLELVREPSANEAAVVARVDGMILGELVGLAPPRVRFDPAHEKAGVPARSLVALDASALGATVLVVCEGGDPKLPTIVSVPERRGPTADVTVDGEKVQIRAREELVLACGEASITLTRDGKILLKGNYVLSRAAGTNRIQGGAVEIN